MIRHLYKFYIPLPKNFFFQDWLKLALWFWRKSRKCEKVTDKQIEQRKTGHSVKLLKNGTLEETYSPIFSLIRTADLQHRANTDKKIHYLQIVCSKLLEISDSKSNSSIIQYSYMQHQDYVNEISIIFSQFDF